MPDGIDEEPELSHDEKFKESLASKMRTPLLADVGLTKFQHVERLGNEEVEGLLDGEVIIENKMDGANLTVAYYEQHGIVIASRNHVIYKNGIEPHGFGGAIEYVLTHDGIQTLVYGGWILRGEWAVKHSILYKPEVYGKFYVFDVQDKNSPGYIHPDIWQPRCKELGVDYIPIAARLNRPGVDEVVALSQGPDDWGSQQKEGIVVKRYDFWNRFGRMTWGKVVSKDFDEKNKLAFGARSSDPAELRFVADVFTDFFVLKEIGKMEDERGRKLVIKDMPMVLGKVWYEGFQEELWTFVKENNIGQFDFRAAHKLAEKKIRDVMLGYCNGIRTIFQEDKPDAAA